MEDMMKDDMITGSWHAVCDPVMAKYGVVIPGRDEQALSVADYLCTYVILCDVRDRRVNVTIALH